MKKTLVGGGGGWKKEIIGAGEGVTNRVPGVPYGMICHLFATLTRFVTQVKSRVRFDVLPAIVTQTQFVNST